MKKILKSRLSVATLLSALLDIVGGLLIAAPILIFLRIHLENTASAFEFWPVISPEVIGDILINDFQALVMYFLAAMIIYLAYIPLKLLFTAGIYCLVADSGQNLGEKIRPLSEYVKRAVGIWPGFVKVAILSVPVYLLFLFIGMIFGGILGKISGSLRPLTILFSLLIGSTYLQMLKIRMARTEDQSLRNSVKSTRSDIAESLGKIVLGNLSVAVATFLVVLLFWYLLRWTRNFDWNLLSGSISLLLQQAIVLTISLGQILRINYNNSILGKGD